MFFAYILRSLKDGTYYYGHTVDVPKRLREHNGGRVRYTRGHIPYVLHYCEEYKTRIEAARRERFFKSIDGYNWLRSRGIIIV
jgi:putative endonuclease